ATAAAAARALVLRTAHEVARAERARRSFAALLREHHDVRTLLSAARLQVDLEIRDAPSPRLSAVRSALDQLFEFVESVKARSFTEMASLEGVEPADLTVAAAAAARAAAVRFPGVRFDLPEGPPCALHVAGGERALSHVL